jgi:ABC-type spermidine/putrescine transport system permease subunit II
MKLIVTLAFISIIVFLAGTFYWEYSKAEGTKWQRALKAAEDSATILWAKFVMLLSAIVGSIGDIGDWLGQPEIRGYAETVLGNPKIVAGVLLAVSLVTMSARKRTL